MKKSIGGPKEAFQFGGTDTFKRKETITRRNTKQSTKSNDLTNDEVPFAQNDFDTPSHNTMTTSRIPPQNTGKV